MMSAWVSRFKPALVFVCLLPAVFACSPDPQDSTPAATAAPGEPAATSTTVPDVEIAPEATATNTPTPSPPIRTEITPTATPAFCQDSAGELEVKVLVGPAEAAGLEPFGVGSVPFTVSGGPPPNTLQGGGNINYQDVLVENWGTYDVTLNMDLTLTGECVFVDGVEQLNLSLEMSGEQNLEVTAQGFHGVYPWSGTYASSFSLPYVEGASFSGEGFAFVLHRGS